jgi:hypothetical protein
MSLHARFPMLDLTAERLIPLADGAKIVPPARSGKRTHFSTLLRWVLKGAKAPDGTLVKLEALRVGGRWMTSPQAIQHFALALTPRLDGNDRPTPRTPGQRRRDDERAATELERKGI